MFKNHITSSDETNTIVFILIHSGQVRQEDKATARIGNESAVMYREFQGNFASYLCVRI